MSHTGVVLDRPVAYKFALDPTAAQRQQFAAHAGAARFAFNHHIARVKANLDQRNAEKSYGFSTEQLTPALSWSKLSFINEFNAWKAGSLYSSPVIDENTRGLKWRNHIAQTVFETASAQAAQALKNFTDSKRGSRPGKAVGFPKFKTQKKTTPSFRLRNQTKVGRPQSLRVTGPSSLRLPSIGEVRIHGCTKKVRRLLDAGRLHLDSCTVKFERGRWWVSLQGIAAPFHHQRRDTAPQRAEKHGRHLVSAGLDRGVKTLAVVADADGKLLSETKGMNALRQAEVKLRRANKAFARTKQGSNGRAKAKKRLNKMHAKVAYQRAALTHEVSKKLTTTLSRLVIEDLHVASMTKMRTLAKAVQDAAMGELGRQIKYKAEWYGLGLDVADRFFASSKTCSGCGNIKRDLVLADRLYSCTECELTIDRDLNAAVNLARWVSVSTRSSIIPELYTTV